MSNATPMMKQYARIKAEYEDAVLLFRMGDFYETFYDDAKIASKVLGLALTTRDKSSENPVPLAGIPHHALDSYLGRLVAAGYRVAICDQIEDPKEAKGLVRRAVREVITPGTIAATSMLDERRPNYLLALAPGPKLTGAARAELSTGEFVLAEHAPGDLRREVLRLGPAEIVVPEDRVETEPLATLLKQLPGIPLTKLPAWEFGLDGGRETLREHFGVANLDGFDLDGLGPALGAAGAALRYLRDLKKRDLHQITSVRRSRRADSMILDATTQRNLELVEPLEHGLEEATLLAVLDETVTPMGARLLREWMLYPLIDPRAIRMRHDAVEAFLGSGADRSEFRRLLGDLCDVARVSGRVAAGQAGPRELSALRRSLGALPEIAEAIRAVGATVLDDLAAELPDVSGPADLIAGAIQDDPPATLRDGGVIRDGYDPELDSLRSVARDGKRWVADLQATERRRTGIPNLKIGYNKVFGYYLEVTNPHLELVPDDYIRKQTLVNAERFVTTALKEREQQIFDAEDRLSSLERDIFDRVREAVARHAATLQKASAVLARSDVLCALSVSAAEHRYVRPTVEESGALRITRGRHPVVERLLEREAFVPNDADLDTESHQIALLTGPNMAGKSTYLRQLALIVLMAQMGSFVPADSATIGVVDRIFTRIGATDALARGRSTFLVEMSETANILNNATPMSLILLDEIGRGTSTFDGLSIAWAVTEYLHNRDRVHPRTLFATHYHELTELAEVLPRVVTLNVLVKETENGIVFLRRVAPGAADQSYGIEVARLAGIPDEVIVRAREVLSNLEESQYTSDATPRLAEGSHGPLVSGTPQMQLFEAAPSEVEREIAELDLDRTTPIEALETLHELRKKVDRAE